MKFKMRENRSFYNKKNLFSRRQRGNRKYSIAYAVADADINPIAFYDVMFTHTSLQVVQNEGKVASRENYF
ncbi:hypothetical protein ACQ33O_02105 [Ferruginibacter sp. SUN002]|uniref:hypothetical protein n=1 Tax=Ferruginibacter sp. SUN002 TaxID=2937789 RepID=UPI003D366E81